MENTLERLDAAGSRRGRATGRAGGSSPRPPSSCWWSSSRSAAAAAPAAGPTCPCWPTASRTPASTGVRSPSDETGGTLAGGLRRDRQPRPAAVLPARRVEPDAALHPHAGHLLAPSPGATDELVPDLATDLGTRVGGRPELDVHAARGRPVRDRPADHLPGRQVRHRAVVRLRRHRRRAHLRRRPARRPGQPLRRARTRTRRPTGSAWPRSRPPTTARSSSGCAPRSRTSRSCWRCRRAARCPIEADTRRATTATTRSPPGRTRSPRSTRRPASCWSATPQWDPATDDVRTALPDQVVVRTGLSGRGAGPGAAGRVGRRRHLRAPACSRPRPPGSRPTRTTRVRDRVDDVTTGARPAARAADRRGADGQRRLPGRGRRRRRPARRCRTTLGGAGQRGAPLAAVAAGARRRPGGPRPAARPRRRPRLARGVRAAGRLHHRAGGGRHAEPASTSPRRSPASWPRSGIRGRGPAAGARPPSTPRTSATRTTWRRTATASSWPPGRRTSRRPGRSWRRWSTAAASATVGNTNYARLERPGRSTRWSTRRAAAGDAAAWREVAGAVGGDVGATCRWPRPGCSWSPASGCATAW